VLIQWCDSKTYAIVGATNHLTFNPNIDRIVWLPQDHFGSVARTHDQIRITHNKHAPKADVSQSPGKPAFFINEYPNWMISGYSMVSTTIFHLMDSLYTHRIGETFNL